MDTIDDLDRLLADHDMFLRPENIAKASGYTVGRPRIGEADTSAEHKLEKIRAKNRRAQAAYRNRRKVRPPDVPASRIPDRALTGCTQYSTAPAVPALRSSGSAFAARPGSSPVATRCQHAR